MKTKTLMPQPLTRQGFAAFGEVIEAPANGAYSAINADTCRRYDALARLDIDGAAGLSIFRAVARPFPFALQLLERHPLGSQAFMPLGAARFVVVAAPDANGAPDWEAAQAFDARAGQGINFYRNVWHHPLIAVRQGGDFLVADRLSAPNETPSANLQECAVPAGVAIQIALPTAA